MGLAGRLSMAASLVAALAVGAGAPSRAFAQDAGKVKQLYDSGMNSLEKGEFAAALDSFKKLIQEDPTQDQVYDLIRNTETKNFLKLLGAGGESEQVARRLLDLGHMALKQRSKDPEAIKKLVEDAVKSDNVETKRRGSRMLMANHGAYAVPYLVPYLGSNDTNERVNAIMALEDIGIEAVLPLVEALQSPDAAVRQNVVVVLRRLLDPRAVPVLVALAGAKDQPDSVKRQAAIALKAYNEEYKTSYKSPTEAFLDIAKKYYNRMPELLRDLGTTYTMWRWSDGKLQELDCPRILYHLALAEKACAAAMAADPNSKEAKAMLSLVYAAERVVAGGAKDTLMSTEEGKALASRLQAADAAILANGAPVLLGALDMALDWNDGPVAIAVLEFLPTFGNTVSLDEKSSVVRALTAPDQTVQWAAALCCVRLAPQKAFARCDLVVPLASKAVALASMRQVLVVVDDSKTAVQLQTEIVKGGMNAVVARSGAEGLIRSKEVPFDAVLVSASLKDMLAQHVVNDIRRDARTSQVPVLVVAPESQAEDVKKLYGEAISGVVTTPASPAVFVPAVRDAASKSPLGDREKALWLSEYACGLIATSLPSPCFDFSRAQGALAGTLAQDKPDSLKVKALAALERFGTAESVDALAGAVANTAHSEAVRAGSAKAIGKILSGKAPSRPVYETLLGGVGDLSSLAVRSACAGALGGMNLTEVQRNEVLARARV